MKKLKPQHKELDWVYTIKLSTDLRKAKAKFKRWEMAREIREFLTQRINELERDS